MEGNYKKHGLFMLVLILIFFNLVIYYYNLEYPKENLTVAVLDVGQGDAIFVESPSGTQLLFDGGPANNVLKELPKVMPFWDRSIDALVITNPDADHISGFSDVLEVYKVGSVFEPGTSNSSATYKNLEKGFKQKSIPNVLLKKGMILDIGGGAYIEVLFPDRDVSTWEANEGSVIARLIYGEISFMLTGDTTKETEKIVLGSNPIESLQSDVLKVAHHGSKTSTSLEFVQALNPKYALISDGKNNKYGHPHQETLNTLESLGVSVLRTDLVGTIIFSCDRMGLCEINK